jgi:hypothetical protein
MCVPMATIIDDDVDSADGAYDISQERLIVLSALKGLNASLVMGVLVKDIDAINPATRKVRPPHAQ